MKLEFIIPTYNRPYHLATLLNSLASQTSPDWTAHVISDGSPVGTFDNLFEYFKDEQRIKFTRLNNRNNDHGHTPRNVGLSQATQEWVCMTGEDNYYVPTFVEEVLSHAKPEVNFIYTDMVHNWGKEYIYVPSLLFWSHIDMGNSIFRAEFAKQMRLNVKNFSADWEMIDKFLKQFPGEIRHIKKCLYVHN
jgi:glycosyltransferase involved in cell wall biosynthesis